MSAQQANDMQSEIFQKLCRKILQNSVSNKIQFILDCGEPTLLSSY